MYTPAVDWTGPDTFTLKFCNVTNCPGNDFLIATVTVTVGGEAINITNANVPNGTQGTLYSQQTLAATEGYGPYSYAITSGALPTGMTLSTAGVLSGTPTAAGTFNFRVTVSDSTRSLSNVPLSGFKDFSFTVAPSTPVANDVGATVAYGSSANPITLNIAGGVPTSVAVATAASHGSATASGTTITYTPTAGYSGPDSFPYTATNVAGTSAPATVTISVSPPTLALNPASLPNWTYGVAYSQPTTASGGAAPYSYGISSGTLPAGLAIDSGTGLISGTPTGMGASTFTVRAQDSSTGPSAPFAITQVYTVTILAPTISVTAPAAGALPAATGGVAYSQTFTASGGQGSHSFALTMGTLPAGVTLSGAGLLSGTPTEAGTFGFSVQATDASPGPVGPFNSAPVAYTLTVTAPVISVIPASLPNGTTAVAYSETVTATGGTTPHSFTTLGTLPTGLTLTSAGVLSGTPTAAGTFNFTIVGTDALGFAAATAYTFVVSDPVITIASPSAGALPAGTGGVAYSQTFTASGGQGTHTFAMTAGATPSGITLSPAGVLSGTPTVAGTFNFSVTATDASPAIGGGPFSSAPVAYSLTINAPTITVSPTTLANATTALAYSETITATGGTTPHTFAITAGTQPTGTTLTSAGVLSGTPTAAGTYNFTITATDALSFTGARAYAITVSDPVITVTSPVAGALPPATGGTAYSQTFTASGGQGSHNFVETGALPAGVTLSPAGVLSGTPMAAGTFNFTVTATDASPGPSGPFSSTPVAYSLTVAAPTITLSPTTLPAGTTALAYATTSVSASGGTAPYTYSVSAGTLPNGLILGGTGDISGTPTAAGTSSFTITATDAHGFTGGQAYSITVADPVVTVTSPASGALPNAEPGVAYSALTFTASGGQGSHSFVVASGALPVGLGLSTSGVLSGTPTATGTFNFSVTATDASPTPGGPFTSAAVAYSLTVTDTLPPALVGMPANIVIEVDFPVTGAIATWTLPTATDNQAGTTVTQTAGLASGATFPLGTTTNSYEARDVANNTVTGSFTVTVTQRLPGQVTMLISSTTDGAFGFTSSEPALNVTVNTASGSGTSGVLTVPVGNHSIAVSVPAGVEIASVSCTDPASSIDPSTLSGTISVTAGAVISCTISGADPAQTTGLIGSFLEARSELILANEPDANRRIERLTGAYTGQGGVSGFGLGFTDERMPFALSFSENEASFGYSLRRAQAQGTADARVASAHNLPIGPRRGMAETMPVTAFGENAQPPARPWPLETKQGVVAETSAATDPMAAPFDIWIEGKLARFDANGGDGRFGIMHAGVDYLVTPRILIGLGAQLDWTDMDGSDESTISGTGYLLGPYVTARLTDNLFLDGRAAWGQSANDVSPFGTYTDKLDATRWLVSLALIGQYDIDRWRITPKAKLAYFEEETESYVDGLGLDIPAIAIATGTLEFGPSLSYRMELANGMLFEPFATLEGIWTFKQENTATAATSTPGLGETGLRGRGEIGFRLAGQSASSQSASSVSSSVFYDGLGNEDFQSWGGKLRFDHRF
ncbi:putative Ig domain-containing protein [Aminobacter sp. UC22_36]|uniref:putative Ig domain-containing protein n=1 Tax=Aminobacter sp. UC22_36 TaxID=3374549 RepID=UPI003756FDBC